MKPRLENVVVPGPGQESVWDFPRPPRVEPVTSRVVVRLGGRIIADTTDAVRVLETSHPPVFYLPHSAFVPGVLQPAEGQTVCEYKGVASYLDLVAADTRSTSAAWFYPSPRPGYTELLERIAVYPGRVDECTVDGERVRAQAGGFYGGWITSRVVGPFKGEPGTLGW